MKSIIKNISLKKKMLYIILLGVAVLSAVSLFVVQLISESYKKLLYQTISNSLSYSAKEIAEYMEKMEKMTMMFLADENIQSGLSTIKDEAQDSLASMKAVQQMRSDVGGYYQSFSDGILKYITVYTEASTAYTNILRADETPKKIQNKMLSQAFKADGGPCWITDYIKEYGLFLVRNIKRIESTKLEPIGNILINVNVDALVHSAAQFGNSYGETAYVLMNQKTMLYHTSNLAFDSAEKIELFNIGRYGIQYLDNHCYFVVHGTIPKYKWDYYCLVSFEKIANQINRVRWMCIFFILLDLCIVIFMCNKLVGNLMIHINRLVDKMHQFESDNTTMPQVDYDYTGRGDELGVLHKQFDKMSETTIRLIQENYINELLKKEAQISSLENQINPHFLYNTFNTIHWRATAIGEKDISDMVEALGKLLRSSLSKKNEEDFTIGNEIEIINSYITIQKIRYEERIQFENQINPELYWVKIPKLVLQPLVENAVYYGVETNMDESVIILSAQKTDSCIHFYVKNNGSEMEEDLLIKLQKEEIKPQGNGIGLMNIDKRIKMLFGNAYGLQLYNEEDYAVAELTIPFTEETEC